MKAISLPDNQDTAGHIYVIAHSVVLLMKFEPLVGTEQKLKIKTQDCLTFHLELKAELCFGKIYDITISNLLQ